MTRDQILGRPGLWAAAVWGFAEGTVFFLVPDILITFVAMFSARKSVQHTAAVLGGSLLAGALLFLLAASGQQWVVDTVKHVPFIRERMVDQTRADFERYGAGALLRGPSSGIPYKVYAVQAPRYTTLWMFLLFSIPARLERFIVAWAGFAMAGLWLRQHPRFAIAVHALFWVVIYSWYWTRT
jgi:membrane protein YqaA with SNARE-associated domain